MNIQDKNMLYYGDNLEILRNKIPSESVDLCYIDPPFNSKRTYNQIYNNIGEDKAQAQAFIDTWSWDRLSEQGYQEITLNHGGRCTRQTIELVKGLKNVLGENSLLAYLVSMTLRITEIHRVLKPTGSFYLHCDPTASHYLKLILDTVFVPCGGDFKNEIVWCYKERELSKNHFNRKHDIIFFYTKTDNYKFNFEDIMEPYSEYTLKNKFKFKDEKGCYRLRYKDGRNDPKEENENTYRQYADKGVLPRDWWEIKIINQAAKERMGYPTQKPEALLEKIIRASSSEGDTVLDAYCGCGTTVVVAERLKRKWTGIDITYQSVSLILKRLEDSFGKKVLKKIMVDGIPKDMKSAKALAEKKDDRLRKEFEKWALLTYTDNRAVVNDKKGADKGIDGITYFLTSGTDTGKAVFQVKSGNVNRATIATLRGDMEREKVEMAVLITLHPPTKPMREEAVSAGVYHHPMMGRDYDRISIVTVEELIENRKRFEMPTGIDVVKKAPKKSGEK